MDSILPSEAAYMSMKMIAISTKQALTDVAVKQCGQFQCEIYSHFGTAIMYSIYIVNTAVRHLLLYLLFPRKGRNRPTGVGCLYLQSQVTCLKPLALSCL